MWRRHCCLPPRDSSRRVSADWFGALAAWIALCPLLIALALLCGACRPAPKSPAITIGWRPLGTWSGRGNEQTDSFNIESGQWRIKWEARNETAPGAGRLRIEVHSSVSGRPLGEAVEHSGIGHDIAYVNEDPRLFHLVIESSNEDWSVSVEEGVVGVPRSRQ